MVDDDDDEKHAEEITTKVILTVEEKKELKNHVQNALNDHYSPLPNITSRKKKPTRWK